MAANSIPPPPVLPVPPLEYDVRYMNLLVRALTYVIQQQSSFGPLYGNTLNLYAKDYTPPLVTIDTTILAKDVSVPAEFLPTFFYIKNLPDGPQTYLVPGQLYKDYDSTIKVW